MAETPQYGLHCLSQDGTLHNEPAAACGCVCGGPGPSVGLWQVALCKSYYDATGCCSLVLHVWLATRTPCTRYVQGTGHQPTPAVLVLIQYCYFWDSKELTIPCSTKRLASSPQTLRVVQAGTSGTRLSSVHTLHTIYLPTPHFHPRLPPFNSKSQSPTYILTLPSPPLPPTHPLSDEALCQSGRHSAGWPERESP